MATNPFDFNASADEAFIRGAKSSNAMGFPQQQQTIGLKAPTGMPRTDAALSAVRQSMLPDVQPSGPTVGYNAADDTYFSGGKTFSGSNLTVIDQADKLGLLDIDNSGKLPPGYRPVPAAKVRSWMQNTAENRGFFSAAGETLKQEVAGIADVGSMLSGAAAFYAPKDSFVESAAGAVNNAIGSAMTDHTPDVYGRGAVASSLISGARGLAPSAAGMAASLAFPIAGTAATGAIFGGAQAWDTYQKALSEGKTPDEARAIAQQTGLVEGAGEALADRFGGVALKGAAGLVKGAGKRAAMDLLGNAGVQAGTEYAQNYGEAAIERAHGLQAADPHAAGMEGFSAALGMSALMGGHVAAANGMYNARLRKDLLKDIDAQNYKAPPAPPAPVPAYQTVGQQAQQLPGLQGSPLLYGSSDLATQQTNPGLISEGNTQNAIDALNGTQTQAENLAQQKATSQSLAAQRAASEVGQQWQDLQAQREQERLNQLWPAAVAGQEWQGILSQKPVRKGDFEDAMNPDVMSGVDPYAAPAAAPSSEWAPSAKPFMAPLDTRMLPKATMPAVSPSGESAPAVAAPVSPAPATEQGLSLADIPYTTASMAPGATQVTRSNGVSKIIDVAGRKVVVVNVNGKMIPFYLSTGNAGKKGVPTGKWYPILGMGKDGWLAKGSSAQLASYYNSKGLRAIAEHLDQTIGDIRNDRHPQATISGQHNDFINSLFTTATPENETAGAKAALEARIAEIIHAVDGKPAEQRLSPLGEPVEDAKEDPLLARKAAAIQAGRIPARATTRVLDKAEKAALVKALDGKFTMAVRTVLTDATAARIKTILELSARKLKILDMLSSGDLIRETSKGPNKGKLKTDNKHPLSDMSQDAVEANLNAGYEQLMQELSTITGQLGTHFAELEKDVGRPAVNLAQRVSKAKGQQSRIASAFSRAYADYMTGATTAANPVEAGTTKDTRERTEFGEMTNTKWASAYHEFEMNHTRFTAVAAVLMKIRFHSANPLYSRVASALYHMKKRAPGIKEPTLFFYTKEGLQVISPKGTISIDPSKKFTDIKGYREGTQAMYFAEANEIHYGPDANKAEVILHELLHAYLLGYVRKYSDAPEVQGLDELRKHVLENLKKKLPAGLKKEIIGILEDPEHGLDEFITYGLTHKGFQEAMRGMKGSEKVQGILQDLWSAFAAIIRKVLRIPEGHAQAFGQFLDATGFILEKGDIEPYGAQGKEPINARNVKVGYDKVAAFFKRITSTPSGNLFQTSKMDESYGTPRKAFTMDEILAHHLQGDWKITPAKEGAPNPDGTRVVRGWELENRNEKEGGKFGIYENERGEVTVQSPEAIAGKSRGSAVLQAALAYAFYNDKMFVNELEGFGMTDAAVTRYAEAMMSAAVKYGTTDFMRPHARQIDPSTRGPEDSSQGGDAFTENAQFYKWGLKGWKNSDAKGSMESRFENNVNLLAKMLTSMAFAAKPELESYNFYADEGFTDKDGNPAKGLTATQKRAIMINSIASMSESSATAQGAGVALMDDEQRKEVGVNNIFYATSLAPSQTGLYDDLTQYAPTVPWLEPIFRAALPGWFAADPANQKARIQANLWVDERLKSLRKISPTGAAMLGMVFPDLNVSRDIAQVIGLSKSERHSPATAANELGGWIEKASVEDIRKAFAYMDELFETGDKKNTKTDLELHVQIKVQDALDALKPLLEKVKTTSKEMEGALDGLKPSELLVRALAAEAIASNRLNADPTRLLHGKKVPIHITSVVAPNVGGVMKTGKFHPVYDAKGKIVKMVQESMATQEKADTSRTFRFRTEDKATGDWNFTEISTVDSLLADKSSAVDARRTVATSFLNTVSIMANAVASRNLIDNINRLGVAQKVVFADEAALLRHLQKADPNKTSVSVSKLSDDESRNERMKFEYRKPGNWVKVPTSAAYGDLAGKVVAGEVMARIDDATNHSVIINVKAYNDLMRIFKAAKTRYSPGTMATNIMSNFTMAHLNNISWRATTDALKLYITYKTAPQKLSEDQLRIMSAFHASGATLGDWSLNEVKQVMYEHMAKLTEVGDKGVIQSLSAWGSYHKALNSEAAARAKNLGISIHEFLGSAYATGDNMFRLAAFMSEYGRLQKEEPGLSNKDRAAKAGAYAKDAFLDYDSDSRFVNAMRQTMLPFVSFTWAFSGKMLKTASQTPWKLASMASAYTIVSMALNAALADGDDDEKRRKRDKMDDRTWFGAYKQIRAGDTYFDLAKWFIPVPFDMRENPNGFFGIHSFPSAITPNNPMLTFIMYSFGYDPYTGKSFHKDSVSSQENVIASLKKMGGVFAPPWASKLTGPSPGLTDFKESPYVYYSRVAGLPVKQIGEKEAQAALQLRIKQTQQAFQKELHSQARAAATGKISREELADAKAKLQKHMEEQLDELKKGL